MGGSGAHGKYWSEYGSDAGTAQEEGEENRVNGWLHYGTETLQVCPYMEGVPVYSDGVLPYLYARTKEEGKLETVFHEDKFNQDKFIAFFERRKTLQILCHVRENKDLVPVGYSWIDLAYGVDGARGAVAGFCFFSEAKKTSRDLGRLGIGYWCIDLKIDILHGVILEENTVAVNYAKRLGFKTVAYVPKWRYVHGKMTGVHVVQLEAADFLPEFEDWYQANKIPVEITG
jgi:hypothetical protein